MSLSTLGFCVMCFLHQCLMWANSGGCWGFSKALHPCLQWSSHLQSPSPSESKSFSLIYKGKLSKWLDRLEQRKHLTERNVAQRVSQIPDKIFLHLGFKIRTQLLQVTSLRERKKCPFAYLICSWRLWSNLEFTWETHLIKQGIVGFAEKVSTSKKGPVSRDSSNACSVWCGFQASLWCTVSSSTKYDCSCHCTVTGLDELGTLVSVCCLSWVIFIYINTYFYIFLFGSVKSFTLLQRKKIHFK